MILKVRVIPNARKTEFGQLRDEEIVLRLAAPPVDGKANKASTEFLARQFRVPRGSVRLVSGEKSRHKIFDIVGLTRADLRSDLLEMFGPAALP